jgi:hypothetical protein
MAKTKKLRGPIDDRQWPTRLQARVVTPGHRPRIHGYDVRGDLLRGYGFPGLVLLTLTGEIPTRAAALAFEKALVFLAPLCISEAPAHAAVLARLCGSRSSGVTGVGAIVLAQHSRRLIADHEDLFEYLTNGTGLLDGRFGPADEEEAAETRMLISALEGSGVIVPDVCASLCPVAAVLVVLHECCSLRDRTLLEQVLVLSRLPCVLAEAGAVVPGRFDDYPIDLPRFAYQDEEWLP